MRNNKGNNKSKNMKGMDQKYSKKNVRGDRERKVNDAQGNGSNYVGDKLSSLNDLSWYNRNPALLQAAGSFPFPYRPGMSAHPVSSKMGINQPYQVPGIAVLDWCPSIGISTKNTDPASVAAKEIFAKVREKFSGSIDADAPDFVIYLMALDSIFAAIGAMKRIYRVVNTYSPDNYTVPDLLLSALGLAPADIQDWKSNKMLAYQYINELVAMTGKFHCPAVMDIFNRHYWMNDNVYLDAPTPNSQMYVFRMNEMYQYQLVKEANPTDAAHPVMVGGLVGVDITRKNVQSMYDTVKGCISALAASDDAYIISGYLMRAFEGVPQFSVDPIGLTDILTPVYVEEVLMQIENSMGTPYGLESHCAVITQDPKTNTVWHEPCSNSVRFASDTNSAHFALDQEISYKPRISIRHDNPSAADCTIASRLMESVTKIDFVNSMYTAYVDCGTEMVGNWNVYVGTDSAGSFPVGPISFYCSNPKVLTSGKLPVDEAIAPISMATISQFDWFPLLYIVTYEINATGAPISTYTGISGDIHNISFLDDEMLRNLHRVCVYSEFNAFGI